MLITHGVGEVEIRVIAKKSFYETIVETLLLSIDSVKATEKDIPPYTSSEEAVRTLRSN